MREKVNSPQPSKSPETLMRTGQATFGQTLLWERQPAPPGGLGPGNQTTPAEAPPPPSRFNLADIPLWPPGHSAGAGQARSTAHPFIQTKSLIGPANSPDEQEADRIAEQLFGGAGRLGTPLSRYRSTANGTAQPRAGGSPGSYLVQRQRSSGPIRASGGHALSAKVEADLQQARGGGAAMPRPLQSQLEQAFGANFGGVRVHADERAHQMNSVLAARAFTSGQDIFFKKGEYAPASQDGQRLLAHELTHVTQQQPQVLGQGACTGGASLGTDVIQRMPDSQYLEALNEVIDDLFFELSSEDFATVEAAISGAQDLDASALLNYLYAQNFSAASFRNAYHIKAKVKDLFKVKATYSDDEIEEDKSKKQNILKSKKQINANKSAKNATNLPSKRDLKLSQGKSQKFIRQVTEKNILPENPEDIAVPQGFVVVKSKNEMLAGLFTNGVATCIAIGMSDDALTAFAFTHLDGEADIKKSIDYMIELINSKKITPDNQDPPSYRAWIGAASADSGNGGQFNFVKLDLTWRNNVRIEFENDKMGQFSLNPHRSNNPAELMKATKGNKVPYENFQDALIKHDAKPLPFKEDRFAESYRKKATGYLSGFLQKLVKVVPKDDDSSSTPLFKMFPDAPAFWGVCEKLLEGQIADLDSGYISSIVEGLLDAFNKDPDLFPIKDLKSVKVVLEMALFNMQKYVESVDNQQEQLAYLQGVELALLNAQGLL